MRDLTKEGSYFMSFFVVSLRVREGFMMDASGLRYPFGKVREGYLAHVVIILVGVVKGGNARRHHLQAVVNYTSSNLKLRGCMEMFRY